MDRGVRITRIAILRKKVASQRLTPERAVWEAGNQVADMLVGLGGYMAERATDVKDVRDRIVAELRGEQHPNGKMASPSEGTIFGKLRDAFKTR